MAAAKQSCLFFPPKSNNHPVTYVHLRSNYPACLRYLQPPSAAAAGTALHIYTQRAPNSSAAKAVCVYNMQSHVSVERLFGCWLLVVHAGQKQRRQPPNYHLDYLSDQPPTDTFLFTIPQPLTSTQQTTEVDPSCLDCGGMRLPLLHARCCCFAGAQAESLQSLAHCRCCVARVVTPPGVIACTG